MLSDKKLNEKREDKIMRYKENNNVIIIDDVMGKGKTSYMIQYINEHPELSFVYCTPLLAEVRRIKHACPLANFKEPVYEDGGRKIDSFNKLLESGENIVLTHSTFANATEETLDYIRDSDYVLVLDETLNTLENFNDVCSDNNQKVNKEDIKMLLNHNFIKVDEYGKVSWTADSYLGGKYSDVEKMAKNQTLLFLDDSMLVWQFPAHIFTLFKEVYVLTYIFDGSILKPYFQYHNISWEKRSVDCHNKRYELVEYRYDTNILSQCRQLIEIYDNAKANDFRNKSLSKSWYSKNKSELVKLKNNLKNFFKNVKKAKSDEILWTCPKEYQKDLQGAGYTKVRALSAEERKLPLSEREKQEKLLSCFLACNMRATNDYNKRSMLAYCCNMFLNPYIKKYFAKKNVKDNLHIEVNEELFALCCMIQWVWRSRIRNNEPISIYIPSTRMRNLFCDWLENRI